VTNETGARPASPPPDPEAYDAPRAKLARARGLDAPYIDGGLDPDPGPGLAEERRLTRWLVAMVASLILGGFVIGLILAILTTSGA
jgi:hypothetical protein